MKQRYLEKVAVIAVDPITVPDEHFNPDCLPPVEATDLLSYLVLETSSYPRQHFNAYKSLEAYNFMMSGFITSVQGCAVTFLTFILFFLTSAVLLYCYMLKTTCSKSAKLTLQWLLRNGPSNRIAKSTFTKVTQLKNMKICKNKKPMFTVTKKSVFLVYSKPLYPCYMCRIVIKIGTSYIFLDG